MQNHLRENPCYVVARWSELVQLFVPAGRHDSQDIDPQPFTVPQGINCNIIKLSKCHTLYMRWSLVRLIEAQCKFLFVRCNYLSKCLLIHDEDLNQPEPPVTLLIPAPTCIRLILETKA